MADSATELEQGTSPWDRLRRRKVVQWGLLYAAGAWGFLQGLEYAASTFHWPERVQQLATLGLVVLLPVVLVLAWYHGDRGERRISGVETAIVTLLFLLGGGIFWQYQQASERTSRSNVAMEPGKTAGPPADSRPSIAVLPFENRSRLEDDAFFVDGIHDDILTQLSKISALRVISRTSVERFRKTNLSVQQIAQQLGVKSILEGGVQRSGDRVRVNVQLIDADADAHHWAETYDRELTAANIFAIQSELAQAIANALQTTLTPAEQIRTRRAPTQDLEAWEAYQLGKQRMARRTSQDLVEAERFFRRAIKLDPSFALSYVGLADTLILEIDYNGIPQQVAIREAQAAAEEALRLDPNLAEAWTSMAAVLNDGRQPERVESMYRRAIELNPNYAQARHWYAFYLNGYGRFKEALSQIQKAAELDPLSSIINQSLGDTFANLGLHEEAEAAYRKVILIDPTGPGGYMYLGVLYGYGLGRIADAVPLAQRATQLDPDSPTFANLLALLYLDIGEEKRAFDAVDLSLKRWPDADLPRLALLLPSLCRSRADESTRLARRAFDAFPQTWEPLTVLRNMDVSSGLHDQAISRYKSSYPDLLSTPPRVAPENYGVAIDLAFVLQEQGHQERAGQLLAGAARVVETIPRLGLFGTSLADVQIHALQGRKQAALAALRTAAESGWRGPARCYFRDVDPNLSSIRDEPEFKTIFAGIERDVAKQRAALAARPKDAPLDLAATGT